MTDKKELLNELQEKFEQTQNELGFKATFEELDEIFYLKDAVLSADFVSENFSRQLCSRIVETFMNWNNYLHGLIMPNPQSMINMHESKMFEGEKRKDIIKLMTKAMGLVTINTKIGLTKDKKLEAKFIDDAFSFWKNEFKPKLIEIITKVNDDWGKG